MDVAQCAHAHEAHALLFASVQYALHGPCKSFACKVGISCACSRAFVFKTHPFVPIDLGITSSEVGDETEKIVID